MSFMNDGRLPSMAWPMNCPIQPMTKMSRQVSHSGQASVSSQRTMNASDAERDGRADAESHRQGEVVDDGERRW